MKTKKVIVNVHATALLLLSLYLLFLFLASGHNINFEDFAQIKLLIELLIFFITAMLLFFKKGYSLLGKVLLTILLTLVQLSMIDLFIEIADVEYGNKKPILILIMFSLLFISNLFMIYLQIKGRTNLDNKSLG